MRRFYTVDRSGQLSPGLALKLTSNYSACRMWLVQNLYNKQDVINRLGELYPDGLSPHGIFYLVEHELVILEKNTRKPLPMTHHIPMIEAIFELVRLNEFPERPSRMQSIFGWVALGDAIEFNNNNGGKNAIYAVNSKRYFIADQNLLYLGASVIGTFQLAKNYWSGYQSSNCKLEAIIPLPTIISERMNI